MKNKQIQDAIAQIKQAASLVSEAQDKVEVFSKEWHALETIDDKLFAALTLLGD